MALKLRRGKGKEAEDTSPKSGEAVLATPAEPGKPGVPSASYNVMTVRYAVQQRRNLVAIVLMGIVAIMLVLAVGNWLKLRTDQASAMDSIASTEQEVSILSQQLTEMSDTEGLAPKEVDGRLRERQQAFQAAVGTELAYGRLVVDINSLNTARVWVTGYTFTAGPTPSLQVSGRAIDPLDVSDWYDVFDVQISYATLTDAWPQFSGTPGEATAEVLWTANIELSPEALLDRAAQYGIELPEDVVNPVDTATDPENPNAAPTEEATG